MSDTDPADFLTLTHEPGPCACGGAPEWHTTPRPHPRRYIRCTTCHRYTDAFRIADLAVWQWDRRQPPPPKRGTATQMPLW